MIFQGDTHIPLEVVIRGGSSLCLNTKWWNFYVNLKNTDTDTKLVINGTVTLSFNNDSDPILTYEWQPGDTDTIGNYNFQFRAQRKDTGKKMFFSIVPMIIRSI
jgi:hypothetical protein